MGNPDNSSKLLRLVRALIRKTAADEIEWGRRSTFDDEEEYEYSTFDSTAIVSLRANDNQYSFTLLNSQALVIGRLAINQFSTSEVDDALMQLHDVVRRKVLRIDDTIDRLLAELDGDDDAPF